MQIIKLSLLAAFFSSLSLCQLNKITAENIAERLLKSENIENLIYPPELALSKRLGIIYDSVKYKFLISYDLDTDIREQIGKGLLEYKVDEETLEENFSRIKISIPGKNYKKEFYFRDSMLVSPPFYFSRNWDRIESKYFVFLLSDKNLFNNYSLTKLDNFIEKTGQILGYSQNEMNQLKDKKIYYFLCRDEKEVEQLTGYQSRGNYILAYDYIITTYNCHYHEIVHLLLNNKLKNIALYTHPFLQEGMAVALGARGGYEPGVILDLGKFLENSGFINFRQLLNNNEYRNTDPSMSYPVSGLYNLFLIEQTGIENYLLHYRKYSGNYEYISNLHIDTSDLPAAESWQNYIKDFDKGFIHPMITNPGAHVIQQNEWGQLAEDDKCYFIKTNSNLLISFDKQFNYYHSKIAYRGIPGKNL